MVQLMATDNPSQVAAGNVVHDMLKRLGVNAELVATDWGTVVQRRASREPVEKGGWSLFISNITGADTLNPAANHVMRSSGLTGTWFGTGNSNGVYVEAVGSGDSKFYRVRHR